MTKRVFLYSVLAIAVLFSIAAISAVGANLDQWNKSTVKWQNGNLGKAGYSEGSVVPFRLAVDGMAADTDYTIHINFDVTKGGAPGYDFLATYDATETNVNLCGTDGGGYSPLCASTTPTGLTGVLSDTIPFDAGSTTFATPPHKAGLSIAGAIANSIANGNTNLTIFGATFVSIGQAVYSGSTSANSSGDYTVVFHTPATCTPDPTECVALLAWGGHLAQSSYWQTNTNLANGAGAINGSSYHMRTSWIGRQPG